MSGCFKEETCSKCSNFVTIPACYKCRVYTGDPCAPDFSGKGKEVTKNWKAMREAEKALGAAIVEGDWVARDKEPL